MSSIAGSRTIDREDLPAPPEFEVIVTAETEDHLSVDRQSSDALRRQEKIFERRVDF